MDEEGVRWLSGWIGEHADWSRRRLAGELCVLWDWRDGTGRPKDLAARSFLLKMEQRGWITLPPLEGSLPQAEGDHWVARVCSARGARGGGFRGGGASRLRGGQGRDGGVSAMGLLFGEPPLFRTKAFHRDAIHAGSPVVGFHLCPSQRKRFFCIDFVY